MASGITLYIIRAQGKCSNYLKLNSGVTLEMMIHLLREKKETPLNLRENPTKEENRDGKVKNPRLD